MAKKKRVFLVEDIETTRDAFRDRLELEGYSVVTAIDLPSAADVLNRTTFHVALVDIMLDGAKNTANRDGVEVIRHLNSLGEGTMIIPLTGQDKRSFVRDSFKDYGVFDFLDKHEDITVKGWEFAIGRIEAAISRSELDDTPAWSDIVQTVLFPEEEQVLVNNVNTVTGGTKFDILERTLCAAIREFQPLVGKSGVSSAFNLNETGDQIVGEFWSKSHGKPVRFVISGSKQNVPVPTDSNELFYRKKAKLSIMVHSLDGFERSDFHS